MDMAVVLAPIVNEIVRDFGPWAIVPMALGFLGFEMRRRMAAKDDEIQRLRTEVRELQEKRVREAREMIRVAELGAASTAAHTESETRLADLIEALLRRNSGPNLLGWRR